MLTVLMLVAVAAVSVAAGGLSAASAQGQDGAAVAAAVVPPKTLTGKIWVLTALLGKPPVRDTEVTSEFTAGGKVSGSSGCNHYSGTYSVAGGTIRISSTMASTRMACTRAVSLQEGAFLKALAGARSYGIHGGSLTLRSAGGRVLVRYKAQSQALAGTSWDVLAYNNGKQAVVSVLAGTKLTASFGKDGQLTGFAGCNDYNAPYKGTAPKISIGPVASTRKHCADPPDVMDQESQYLASLQTAATYRVEGTKLELRTAEGALAAELQRKSVDSSL